MPLAACCALRDAGCMPIAVLPRAAIVDDMLHTAPCFLLSASRTLALLYSTWFHQKNCMMQICMGTERNGQVVRTYWQAAMRFCAAASCMLRAACCGLRAACCDSTRCNCAANTSIGSLSSVLHTWTLFDQFWRHLDVFWAQKIWVYEICECTKSDLSVCAWSVSPAPCSLIDTCSLDMPLRACDVPRIISAARSMLDVVSCMYLWVFVCVCVCDCVQVDDVFSIVPVVCAWVSTPLPYPSVQGQQGHR